MGVPSSPFSYVETFVFDDKHEVAKFLAGSIKFDCGVETLDPPADYKAQIGTWLEIPHVLGRIPDLTIRYKHFTWSIRCHAWRYGCWC